MSKRLFFSMRQPNHDGFQYLFRSMSMNEKLALQDAMNPFSNRLEPVMASGVLPDHFKLPRKSMYGKWDE